jgi:hypothetical protein
VKIKKMRSLFLEGLFTTQCHQSSKMGPEWYTLSKKVMRCVWDMLLQSMEMEKEGLLSTQHIWKGLVKNRLRESGFYLLMLKKNTPSPVSVPVPFHSLSRVSQAKKDKKEKKEYLKHMSELAKIFQQQPFENNKLEKLFSDSNRQ